MKRKIVFLGGGSRYFERVLAEIALRPELAGWSVVLFDIDKKRMDLIYRASRHIVRKTKCGIKLSSTTDMARALDGADYAISSIGVHGTGRSWHMADVRACAPFGIIHTTGDTVGPAGVSQGLRIIPIYLKIARAMKRCCPEVILLNHSNPMSPICRAVIKDSGINTIGYCHNVAGAVNWFSKVLGIPPEELDVTAAGPNHMSWLLAIHHNGRDVYPELKRRILKAKPEDRYIFSREVLRLLDVLPVGGDRHAVEFFPHAREATTVAELRYGMKWRAQKTTKQLAVEISSAPDELKLRAKGLRPPAIPDRPSPESMGEQICSLALGREKIHYVNTPNLGAVPNLPEWAVVELKAVVSSRGARPLYAGELPLQAARWSQATIYAHELLVDAAIEGSRKKAIMALACDPMMLNFTEVEKVFDAVVEAQGPRLARFRKRKRK